MMMLGEVEFVYVRTVGVTPGSSTFYVYAVLLECIKIIEWSMYRVTILLSPMLTTMRKKRDFRRKLYTEEVNTGGITL